MFKSISFFGDSIGKGVVYDPQKERYASLDENFVYLVGKENNLEIKNYSRFGYTVPKMEELVDRKLLDVESSDIVVLEVGGNDANFCWKEISENPDIHYECVTPMNKFISAYTSIITKLRACGKKVVVLNLPPIDAEKYFKWISRTLNGANIIKWLGGSTGYIYRFHEMYNMAVCNLANSLKAPLVDIRSAFLNKNDYSNLLCEDGIHPNRDGHLLITSEINSAIALLK